MHLADYLNAFSIEDLRELAARRGAMLSQAALNSRQALVRSLVGVVGRYDTIYPTVMRLNQAELTVLRWVLGAGKRAGVSRFCAEAGAEPAAARPVLESLRLWGLLFPEGDWDHIVFPPSTQMATHYFGAPARHHDELPSLSLTPPALDPAEAEGCRPRPGSLTWDQAELLARIARGRFKLTQAGRMNRRDLRAMDAAFAVPTSGYSTFLYMLSGSAALIYASENGIIAVRNEVDGYLGQPEETRASMTLAAWTLLRGYPESAVKDPADEEYVPAGLFSQRERAAEALVEARPGAAVTIDSLVQRLVWGSPLAFGGWDSSRDAPLTTRRLARSLYWLGLAALDDPEKPQRAGLTALGNRVLRGRADGPALIPEEPQFFLQPNAEVFAPPNLSPRTLFHLRRITGEKKGGAAGMYPLNADSVRRALDTGLTVEAIAAFLERFSKTGLPGNVRALLATAGRQHGRIRLVPAGYVMVTDTPGLLDELQRIATVAQVIGEPLAERVAAVAVDHAPELLKRLRAKGYAPLDLSEVGEVPPLADDPAFVPPLPNVEPDAASALTALLGVMADEEEYEPVPVGVQITDPERIWDLIEEAVDERLVVEIEYESSANREVTVREICPVDTDAHHVIAQCRLRGGERHFTMSRIRWARLTGDTFANEYV